MHHRHKRPHACVHLPGTAPWHEPGTAPVVQDWLSEEHQLEEEAKWLTGEVARAGDERGYCIPYMGEFSVSRGDTVYEVNPDDLDDYPVDLHPQLG
jgi:hypothetical protein